MLTGYVDTSNTPDFTMAIRSLIGEGTEYRRDIDEVIGNNCYNPTSCSCFVSSNDYLTGKDYKQF